MQLWETYPTGEAFVLAPRRTVDTDEVRHVEPPVRAWKQMRVALSATESVGFWALEPRWPRPPPSATPILPRWEIALRETAASPVAASCDIVVGLYGVRSAPRMRRAEQGVGKKLGAAMHLGTRAILAAADTWVGGERVERHRAFLASNL